MTGDELEAPRKLYDEVVYDEKVRQNEGDNVLRTVGSGHYDSVALRDSRFHFFTLLSQAAEKLRVSPAKKLVKKLRLAFSPMSPVSRVEWTESTWFLITYV